MAALSYAPVFAAAIASALGIHLVGIALYRIFRGPLRDLPGPWYTKFTGFWLTFNELAFRQALYIDTLFAKYGPVVRLGPDTVAFMDSGAAKTIYSKYPKGRWYEKLARVDGLDVSFSMVHPAEHALRRRGFGSHYTVEHLSRFQQDFQDNALVLVSHLIELAGRDAVNCLAMFQHLLVDVIGVSAYDTTIDATKHWCGGAIHEATTAIHDLPIYRISKMILPGWIWSAMKLVPVKRLQAFMRADKIVCGFAEESLNRERARLDEGGRDPHDRVHLVSRLLQYRMPNGKSLNHEELVTEIELHTGAAVDTTSTSASYGLWMLARHPNVLQALQAELDDAMPDGQRLPDATVLAALPYLNAVIKEVLRLYGAAPALLPREVPSTGQPLEIHGYKLPPGIIVATQSYSAHRQSEVFEDPLAFKPERWLNEAEAMKANYFPFGQGARICAGQLLAIMILRMTFAALLRNFNPVLPPQTTEKSMEPIFAFVIAPRGGKCDILFVPRKDAP
ncbi:cytochrome P450 [Auriculariales sp. MPI-PUGE-AT-0066]|nr:cytochrome P450 [Auriculariales sp. MPI-PUGE-AT-0066]